MRIKIWGCWGSIASPGQGALRYGGNCTCLEIRPREGGVIIVDAGSGVRLLGKKLMQDKSLNELYMILTHAHWDHLSGFPFFTPAYLSRFKINVYGGPNAQGALKNYLSHQMSPPYFPVDFNVMKATFTFGYECPDMGTVGLVEFIPIPLSHPNGGYGFKFVKKEKTVVFLTDNELDYSHPGGLSRKDYVEFCRNVDLLIHDAQYTDEDYKITRGWGHSTYFDATQLAIEAGVKELCLFHHDPDRTDDDLDRQVEYCHNLIQKAESPVKCYAAAEGLEIHV
jgi:phosphoribosyl 1,2-cyclic phosphodiesterase